VGYVACRPAGITPNGVGIVSEPVTVQHVVVAGVPDRLLAAVLRLGPLYETALAVRKRSDLELAGRLLAVKAQFLSAVAQDPGDPCFGFPRLGGETRSSDTAGPRSEG